MGRFELKMKIFKNHKNDLHYDFHYYFNCYFENEPEEFLRFLIELIK